MIMKPFDFIEKVGDVRNKERLSELVMEGKSIWEAIAIWFKEIKIEDFPNIPSCKKTSIEKSVYEIRKLVVLDKFDEVTIVKVLEYTTKDNFLSRNIMAIPSIRKIWKSGMTAFESVVVKLSGDFPQKNKESKDTDAGVEYV